MIETVTLEEVCTINPRAPKELNDDEIVSFLPMAAVSEEGRIDYEQSRSVKEVRKGYTYFERGDVLIAKITPCFENGKATLTSDLKQAIGFGSTEFHVIRAGSRLVPEYVFHLLWSRRFRTDGEKSMTGSAGQKRVPADFVRQYKIPLPPLTAQQRYVDLMAGIQSQVLRHRRAIGALAELYDDAQFRALQGDLL